MLVEDNMKAYRYIVILLALVASTVFVLKLFSNEHDSKRLEKRVDKHFFFELLQQVDINPREKNYNASVAQDSPFVGLMDRTLMARYLAERFAYTSFIQFGGCKVEQIYNFIPETVKSPGCIETRASSYLDSVLGSGSKYEIVMVQSWSLNEIVMDKLLAILHKDGTLVITDTNPSGQVPLGVLSYWDILVKLRQRNDIDMATVDIDGGISIVHFRRNTRPLNVGFLLMPDQPISGADVAATAAAPQNKAVPLSLMWETFLQNHVLILNLMSFESIHIWLAPTGNVDALTAFGGEKSIDAFKDAVSICEKCALLLRLEPDPVNINKALSCLQDAATNNRLTLRGRWLLALLLFQQERIVEAVAASNELLALSPIWYRWFLRQTAASAAHVLFDGDRGSDGLLPADLAGDGTVLLPPTPTQSQKSEKSEKSDPTGSSGADRQNQASLASSGTAETVGSNGPEGMGSANHLTADSAASAPGAAGLVSLDSTTVNEIPTRVRGARAQRKKAAREVKEAAAREAPYAVIDGQPSSTLSETGAGVGGSVEGTGNSADAGPMTVEGAGPIAAGDGASVGEDAAMGLRAGGGGAGMRKRKRPRPSRQVRQ